MQNVRRARFERCSSIPHIHLTRRDVDILAHLGRHRVLRSSHIASLVTGSRQQVLRRLQLLFHHGYVDRPRSQIEYFHRGGSQLFVYALSPRGSALLRENGRSEVNSTRFPKRNLSPFFLQHAVQQSEIMVALEVACRGDSHITFISGHDLREQQDHRVPFEWRVKIDAQHELGVIPDDVFALEHSENGQSKSRVLYFVESDRSTMPIERHDLTKSSFRRKLLAYEASWIQKIHRSRFGCDRLRVLTITTSTERTDHLIQVCSKLKRGKGLFLFTDLQTIRTQDPLSACWRTAQGTAAGVI